MGKWTEISHKEFMELRSKNTWYLLRNGSKGKMWWEEWGLDSDGISMLRHEDRPFNIVLSMQSKWFKREVTS